MNPTTNPMTTGIIERQLYSLVLGVCIWMAQQGWITGDFAPYLAAGVMAAVTGVFGWWINRPAQLLTAASNVAPKDTTLVITPDPGSGPQVKAEARGMAHESGERVTAKGG